ncbi:hypothetical protein QQS16_18210 [Streptomyces sp. ALI-76-A]|nr:hypothetical protein [Streptomyces sp. ALI-76-A]MDL5202002.1 hypothetical protein [Streptomyces sp. ALI-76-A]
MGYLWDKLTGTRYPETGVAPLSATEVRAALFAINGPDKPYRVRNALPAEKADLVAEWHVLEPVWGSGRSRRQVERTLKTRMRLDPSKHEVRVCDEQREVTRAGKPPGRIVARERGRGPQIIKVSWRGYYERGADGRRHKVETFRFDSRDMRNPLQAAVLGAGWTWRGMFKL